MDRGAHKSETAKSPSEDYTSPSDISKKPGNTTPLGIPPKTPTKLGGGFSYPGGEKTFLGCFQRVKVEGRKGRGYWEWKAAELRKIKSGHEGDDELTSLESDTMGRRSAAAKLSGSHVTFSENLKGRECQSATSASDGRLNFTAINHQGKPIPGTVRVLPPYFPPYQQTPSTHFPHQKQMTPHPSISEALYEKSHDEPKEVAAVERITITSYEQPRLTPLLNRARPPKEPPSSSPSPPAGGSPSAPPKDLVYADAEERRTARSQPVVGQDNQSVGYLEPSKYFRDKQFTSQGREYYGEGYKRINVTSDKNKELKISDKNPAPGYDQYFQNQKLELAQKSKNSGQDKAEKCIVENENKNKVPASIYPKFDLDSSQFDNTLSSQDSLYSKNYTAEFEPDTKPLLLQKSDDESNHREFKTNRTKETESRSQPSGPLPIGGLISGRTSSSQTSFTEPTSSHPKKPAGDANRRSGALVWVSQPGGGAKLEWVPTPGLATIRAVPASTFSANRSTTLQPQHNQREGSLRDGVAGLKSGTQVSNPKGIIKRGDEGGGGGGGTHRSNFEARVGGSSLARAASDDPRANRDGNASRVGAHSQPGYPGCPSNSNRLASQTSQKNNFESGQPKNAFSSAPGVTRSAGRTNLSSGSCNEKSSTSRKTDSGINPSLEEEDKVVTVAGRGQGQTVRIRVRPEVHAYLSNLPVIRGSLGAQPHSDITERRDSTHSANSSSASGLTVGSGEGSTGYQEDDYTEVVDEYTLLQKAVDDHDPEALRLLTATEASLYSEGGGGSEYPYLREMKERLLIAKDTPMSTMDDPSQLDQENQLLEVHQTPVATVVKLNADGYGSHTSPTHRVESFYTGTLDSRKSHAHEYFPKNAKTSSFITLSLLYATLLVVVCLGFVLSEVLTHNVPLYYYEAFFTYLYGLSIFFLLYVFCYLLSGSTREKTPKNQKVRKPDALPSEGSPTQEKLTVSTPKPKKQKTTDNDHSHGSFFLRIGAIAFGLGTMIYNGLEFGVFFEIPMNSPCYQILRGVNPLLQLIFTFMQMYFIFMNARLNIHKFKFLARFGLMHIVATNLCVWVRTLVRESLKEINEFRVTQGYSGEDYMIMEGIRRALANRGLLAPNRYMYNLDAFSEFQEVNGTMQQGNWATQEDLVNRTCERMEIMGSIVSDSAPYLYPFIVEYSLIGAAVVYIMWKHIGRNPKYVYDPEAADGMSVVSRRCHSKVDCIGASKGLFCGLLVLVATLICLILFFVLIHREELRMLAIYLADVSHCGIMFLSIIAIFIGFCRVRHLKFFGEREEELDDILLMVSAFGLFAYAIFSAVAGSLSAFTEEPNLLVMVTGILSVIQVMIQMVFIKDTQRRQVALPEQERTKPGRQIVTFLLICNLAMWVIYTFETQKVEANPVQLEFFGKLSWTILLRCTLPLAIFHRFHSSVVLAAIWKNSYKTRLE